MATAPSELIVLPPVAEGRLYPVQSGDHVWYVDISCGQCDCPAFWFQSPEKRRLCKHAKAVARHLKEAGQCAACHGTGKVTPTGAVRYVGGDGKVDMSALNCVVCDGNGRAKE